MLEEDADDLGEALPCSHVQGRSSIICLGAVHLTSAMAPTTVEKHKKPAMAPATVIATIQLDKIVDRD